MGGRLAGLGGVCLLLLCGVLLPAPAQAQSGAAPLQASPAVDPRIQSLQQALLHATDAGQAEALLARLEALRESLLSPTVRLMLHRGQREQADGKLHEALGDISDALELQPEQSLLWRDRAAVRAAQADQAGALQDLGNAINRDPADVQSWSGLSLIEESAGKGEPAYAAWEHVLRLDPMIQGGAARLSHLHHLMLGDPT